MADGRFYVIKKSWFIKSYLYKDEIFGWCYGLSGDAFKSLDAAKKALAERQELENQIKLEQTLIKEHKQ
jgi:hypothetical protein